MTVAGAPPQGSIPKKNGPLVNELPKTVRGGGLGGWGPGSAGIPDRTGFKPRSGTRKQGLSRFEKGQTHKAEWAEKTLRGEEKQTTRW